MGIRKPIKLRKLEKLRSPRKVRKLQDLQGSTFPTVINAVNNGKGKTLLEAGEGAPGIQQWGVIAHTGVGVWMMQMTFGHPCSSKSMQKSRLLTKQCGDIYSFGVLSLSIFREHAVHLLPGKSHTTARGHQGHRLCSIAY